jgi:hypothetical protein
VPIDGPKSAAPGLPGGRSWSRFWGWVVGTAFAVLLLTAMFVDRFVAVFLAMPGALAIAFGVVEMLAPRRFLHWRAADASSETQHEVVEGFDAALGIERGEDGDYGAAALRRVRAIGISVFIFGCLAVAAAVVAERGGHL